LARKRQKLRGCDIANDCVEAPAARVELLVSKFTALTDLCHNKIDAGDRMIVARIEANERLNTTRIDSGDRLSTIRIDHVEKEVTTQISHVEKELTGLIRTYGESHNTLRDLIGRAERDGQNGREALGREILARLETFARDATATHEAIRKNAVDMREWAQNEFSDIRDWAQREFTSVREGRATDKGRQTALEPFTKSVFTLITGFVLALLTFYFLNRPTAEPAPSARGADAPISEPKR
jgi:hypothetical protein